MNDNYTFSEYFATAIFGILMLLVLWASPLNTLIKGVASHAVFKKIIIFCLILFALIYVQQMYYIGRNYSYIFEIIIIVMMILFTLIYKDNQYRYIFF